MRALLCVLLLLGAALPLAAQPAESGWLDLFSLPGLTGEAFATLPDGAGHLVGGSFVHADGHVVGGIARWTGAAWEGLGGGLRLAPDSSFQIPPVATVFALARTPDGRVWVAGLFDEAVQPDGSSLAVRNVAVWTGTAWEAVGGLDASGAPASFWAVRALAVLDGHVYAGGTFGRITQPDGTTVGTEWAARWTGAAWEPLDAPNLVYALHVHDGTLYAGIAGDSNTSPLLRWTGTAFEPVPAPGPGSGTVYALESDGSRLVVGGTFLAAWTGTAWEGVGGGVEGTVTAVRREAAGSLLVAGDFRRVGPPGGDIKARGIARWSGTAWSALPEPTAFTRVLPWGSETLLSGFDRLFTDGNPTTRSNGAAVLSAGDRVRPAQGTGGGDTALWAQSLAPRCGGGFAAVGQDVGPQRAAFARWTGAAWATEPADLAVPRFAPPSSPDALPLNVFLRVAALPGCDAFVVGGSFEGLLGGADASANVAVWTGAAWAPMGRGANRAVTGLAALPDGSVVAAGFFDRVVQSNGTALDVLGLARWTPAGGWEAIGAPLGNVFTVLTLHADGDGVLVTGGFDRVREAGGAERAAGGVARWSPGSGWETFGGAVAPAGLPRIGGAARWNGGVAVGGPFRAVAGPDGAAVPADGAAWWDGTAWHALGTQPGLSFERMANADGVLVAAGLVGEGPGAIHWWDGTAWRVAADGPTFAGQLLPADGRLYLVGAFSQQPGRQLRGLAAVGLAGIVADESAPTAPEAAALAVVPNPAAGRAAVAFTLDAPARVRVSVVDALGREVLLVLDAERAAGAHRAEFSVRSLPPGVYAARVQGAGTARARTFTVTR